MANLTTVIPLFFFAKRYLVLKALGTLMSLVFAFAYSTELGIVNRSILAYVLTLNIMIWIFLTSGTTLTLRKNRPELSSQDFASFRSLILVQSLLGVFFFTIGMLLFSIHKEPISVYLFLLGYLYFLMSGLARVLVEVSIAYLDFKLSGYLECLAVIIQIVSYFVVFRSLDVTIAVRLMLSFIFSYLVISFIFLLKMRFVLNRRGIFTSPLKFWKKTNGNHSIGISLGVMDRMDKLIVAFIFPTGILAKYSVMSSLISYFRFIPEFVSRVLIAKKETIFAEIKKHARILFIGLLFFGLFYVLLVRSVIAIFLGQNWILAISIYFLFGIQEILRGAYQLAINQTIKQGIVRSAKYLPLLMVLIALSITALTTHFYGLIGVPIAFSMAYIFAILTARRSLRN